MHACVLFVYVVVCCAVPCSVCGCVFVLVVCSAYRWRIVCIFSATPDLVISWPPVIKPRLGPRAGRWTWNLVTWRWNNVFTQRKRAEAWAFTRVAMLTLPAFFITCVLFPSGLTDMAEQLWTWYDFAAIAMFLAVALRLVSIRKLVTLDELVESRMLMWFSVAAIQYFIIDNLCVCCCVPRVRACHAPTHVCEARDAWTSLWFLVIRPLSDTDPHHQLKFWAFEVYQVVSFDILFCCTTGWVAWVCLRNPAVASRTATTSTSASQNTVNPLMRSTGYDVSTNSVSSNHAHSTGPLASDGPKHSSSEAQV